MSPVGARHHNFAVARLNDVFGQSPRWELVPLALQHQDGAEPLELGPDSEHLRWS